MLDVEPSNRPTAVQILNHAWMKSSNQPNTHLFTKEKASSDVKVKMCHRKQRDKINTHFYLHWNSPNTHSMENVNLSPSGDPSDFGHQRGMHKQKAEFKTWGQN